MGRKDEILQYIRVNSEVSGRELCDHLALSRQALHQHMKVLISEGMVLKSGGTKGVRYRLPDWKGTTKLLTFHKRVTVQGAAEDRIWDDAVAWLGLRKALSKTVFDVLHYAFTEMVNNVIDHSQSLQMDVRMVLASGRVSFSVRDWGIGVFSSIQHYSGLESEADALTELLKGKTTTQPARHAGEGIFFTSRATDYFRLGSHRLALVRMGMEGDVYAEHQRKHSGSLVEVYVDRFRQRRLESVFSAYAPERHDYVFGKTSVAVRLFKDSFVSRSEARRLLAGLDRFREIELDFEGVSSMGQGFADEVFRVFQNAHPQIHIHALRLAPALEAMVAHVKAEASSGEGSQS